MTLVDQHDNNENTGEDNVSQTATYKFTFYYDPREMMNNITNVIYTMLALT